jgi:hypothetical protein
MGMTPRTYTAIGSEPSDLYDITTTTTALSIKITQKTYRDITAFADNGDSRTLVTCDRHCFKDSDEVKIATGSYAGTYTLEWVDYDSFIIDIAYVDNVATQCYSDTQDYNKPPGLARAMGMAYYVYTSPPGYTGNRWTRTAYGTTHLVNPTTIIAQPSNNFGDYNQIPEVCGLSGGMYNSLLGYGIPFVDITGTITVTAQDIEDEFVAANFPYHCGYSTQGYGNKPQFNLMAASRFSSTASFTLSNAVVVLGGELEADDESTVNFRHCVISVPVSTFTGYYEFTATNSVFFNASNSNTLGGWIYGDNNRIYAVPRFGAFGDSTGTYNNLYDVPNTKAYGLVKNKDYRPLYDSNETMQVSYAATVFENCTLFPLYMPTRPGTNGLYPDIYIQKDCYIAETGYAWHYRMYLYGETTPLRFDFLNIDTDHVNNVKKVVNNGAGNFDMYFYRRLEFYVQSDGSFISGVTINVNDSAANQYSATTDANGYAYIDVLEQHTSMVVADGTHSSWNSDHDTYFSGFEYTITKEGHESIAGTLDAITRISALEYSMKKIVPVMVGTDGRSAVKVNPKNIGANRDKIIMT